MRTQVSNTAKFLKKASGLFVFLFMITSYAGFAQDSMTAQKVIHRFIEVSGGEGYLKGLKVTSATAKGLFKGDSVDVKVLKVAPGKMYMKYQFAHNGTIESVYNNGRAVLRKDGEKVTVTDSTMLEEMRSQSFLLADLAYDAMGYSMKLVPSEEDSTYKVEIVSPRGTAMVKYYSKRTGYLSKIVFGQGYVSYFSDYATTGGFTVSRKETVINEQGKPEDIFITSFTIGGKYDASVFEF